ncbi:hypothetical protein ACEPAF_2189 [Sanghuangporus sanghuang]
MPVNYVAVVGTPVGSFYHFRLSLVSGATKESVRIDMKPGPRDLIGIAKVEYRSYDFSWKWGPEPIIALVTQGTTVATILGIIFSDENKMDQYTFIGPGQGCRHWCACVLDKLAENRLVHHSVPWTFTQAEAEEHNRFGSSYPMPRIRGTFYQ